MKKILIASTSSSDFDILKPLIVEMKKEKFFFTELLVSGSHFLKNYGMSINYIKKQRIIIDKFLKIPGYEKSKNFHIWYFINGLKKYFFYLKKKKIDYIIVLGDRSELLPLVWCSKFLNIKIMHIHGGEITSGGAIDDDIRHSITKVANFHFVSSFKHKKRVIQMGEDPKTVYNVGALGIDNIKNGKLLDRTEIYDKLKLNPKLNGILLINFNTYTNNGNELKKEFLPLLQTLKLFQNFNIVFTLPSYNPGSNILIKKIKIFIKKNSNSYYFMHLGSNTFFSLARISSCILGNSSSALIELPYFNIPIINIGLRQLGRAKPRTVIDINKNITKNTIFKILNYSIKKKKINHQKIFGNGTTSKKIIKIIKKIDKKKNNNQKIFYDLK